MAQRVIKTINPIRGSGAILKLILDGISTVVIEHTSPFLYPCPLNEAFIVHSTQSHFPLLLHANLNYLNIAATISYYIKLS